MTAKKGSEKRIPHRRYLAILGVLFGIWWVALAIRPLERDTWLLENALAVAVFALLAVSIAGCSSRASPTR